jgi:alpha-galactosidase
MMRVLLSALLALTLAAAPPAPPTAMGGVWLFPRSAEFPGLRMLRLSRDAEGWSGSVTTDWYGDVPMRALAVTGRTARFLIDNGNPRLPPRQWNAMIDGKGLHVIGDIWERHVDSALRRGTATDVARLAFPLACARHARRRRPRADPANGMVELEPVRRRDRRRHRPRDRRPSRKLRPA